MREPDQAGGWRHPGWSWTVRHDGLVPAGYGVATLLAGGVLGIVPSLITGDWRSGLTWALLWTCVGLTVIAVAAFGFSVVARRGRDRLIAQNGTAYVIQEQARFWTDDDAQRFREGIRRRFARVIQVPGPVEAGHGWDWPLDADARHWDTRTDELVSAFRVLNIDKNRGGSVAPNGVFLWAYWAVAMAFGMRVTAADRRLALDVWQRPSRARAGEVEPEIWSLSPHRFGTAVGASPPTGPVSLGAVSPGGGAAGLDFEEHVWTIDLTVSRRGRGRGSGRGSGSARRGPNGGDVSVLLLRFSRLDWGPMPAVADPPPEGPLALRLHDAAGLAPAGTTSADLHELRCVPPAVPAGAQFPWPQFPALAAEAAAWIERKAKELHGRTLLIGTLLPQEVGLGLGVLAGQESRRATWPEHLWPIVREPARRELVVPNLDLGTAAVDSARAGSGGA